MSEEATVMVVFCVTAVVVSVAANAVARRSSAATAVSAAISTIVFTLFAYLQAGYLDPFFPIAVAVAGFYAYIIAYVVGVPFRIVRTNRAVANSIRSHEGFVPGDAVRRPGDWIRTAVTFCVVVMVVTWLVEVARRGLAPATSTPIYLSYGVPLLVGVVSSLMLLRLRRAERLQALLFIAGHCGQCGYDLTGNVSGTCPECGTKIELP